MLKNELERLQERLADLENAANKLMFITSNLDSEFYNDELLKQNLVYALKERAIVARAIENFKQQERQN